jgi:hypothetical protein
VATYTLRLLEDRLGPGQERHARELGGPETGPSSGQVVLYVVAGSVTTNPTGPLHANEAWHAAVADLDGLAVAGAAGAHLLRFELLPQPAVDGDDSRGGVAAPLVATERAAASIEVAGDGPCLLRCDRVDFPPGGIAYLHTHSGSGIRYLLFGDLWIESGERHARVHLRPGGAWFERAGEPVLAPASATGPTAFVRVMVLPAELQGERSIRYLDPADQARPKPQRYTLLVDDLVEL